MTFEQFFYEHQCGLMNARQLYDLRSDFFYFLHNFRQSIERFISIKSMMRCRVLIMQNFLLIGDRVFSAAASCVKYSRRWVR